MTDSTTSEQTRIAICAECHSHFIARVDPEPSEDPAVGLHCPACLEWARLMQQSSAYAGTVRGARGGRR